MPPVPTPFPAISADPPIAARWRLLRTPPLWGAANMAMDEALLRRAARTGEWTLRVYAWSVPTLSLGRNQTARGRYDLDAIGRAGLHVVRRPTGGRGLLHDREVTYSVAAPVAEAGSLRDSYARINGVLVAALRALGVVADVATSRAPRAPGVAPCFVEPAEGELTVGGRKLVGSAQWRDRGALLQHGSIIVDGDQSLVASLLLNPVPPPPPPATLRTALGRVPQLEQVADALEEAVRSLEDADAQPLDPDPELQHEARTLEESYRSPDWTWRR